MPVPLEFWFEFASPYSYIAAMRIEDACRAAGVPLLWRPFLLGPIFTAQLGIQDSPFNVHPVRGRYMWRDVERLSAKYGLPWKQPGHFPRHSVLAARVACVAAGQPWMGDYVRGAFQANFAEDLDISEPSVLKAVLEARKVDADGVLSAAGAEPARRQLRTNTEEAMQRGVFGAPTFFAAGEQFFGQDRLEGAVAWASALISAEPGVG
jgi:2-hydroxychromene-2-carboxylate isomerase